jgi:hypothetical protein
MDVGTTLKRADFTVLRTPGELAHYVQTTYKQIKSDPVLRQTARLRKEPYKTFLEEVMPFSCFCTWKYGNRKDVQCALLSDTSSQGTPGYDAVVLDQKTGAEHVVEMTWPIDGEHLYHQFRQMNEKGRTDLEIWDYNDNTKQEASVKRTLDIARKKSLRDYRAPGGATIIFVFDQDLFWDDNPKHAELLLSLQIELSVLPLLADNVLLMLMMGSQAKIENLS